MRAARRRDRRRAHIAGNADLERFAGARCTAMSPPSLTKARSSGAAAVMAASSSSATAPATAAIGVMNTPAKGAQAVHHAPRHGACRRAGLRPSALRSSRQLVAQLAEHGRRTARPPRHRRRATAAASPQAFSTTSIGPCDRCSRSPVKLLDDGASANMAHTDLGQQPEQGLGLPGGERLRACGGRPPAAAAFIASTSVRPARSAPASPGAHPSDRGDCRISPRLISRPTTPKIVAGSMRVSRPSWFCDTGPRSSSLASAANCVGVIVEPGHHRVEDLGGALMRAAQHEADLILQRVGAALRRPACGGSTLRPLLR